MKKPHEFYQAEIASLTQKAAFLKRTSIKLSFLRLLVFFATATSIYFNSSSVFSMILIGFLGIGLFVFLVVQHIDLKRKRAIVSKKITFNQTEINALNHQFFDLETGKEFIDGTHFFSTDIDLFGMGSFFQFINRTKTFEGKKALANLLKSNDILNITEKQKVITELGIKVHWRQHFSALASLIKVENSTENILKWIKNYQPLFSRFWAVLPIVFSIISVLLIGCISFGWVPFSWLTIWFFVGLGITGKQLKRTQKIYIETDQTRDTFRQYHSLLHEIETQEFSSKLLLEKQQIIQSENKKAAVIFKEFSKILDAFDQRNNVLILVVGNALFLWELNNACRVEKWLKSYRHTVEKWFEVIAFFDANNSLGNFNFNHPNFVFPEIIKDKNCIQSENLGHSLLNASKRVDNDFKINKEHFFILTGANMAGKSTFLRTVSLSIMMANCGLPVCASSFKYSPIKLITSMRTTDSLTEDKSYFYSELKRLKFIVDQIKTEKYFIILDEILKGTNSKDKAIGSRKFVKKLNKSHSTGIIATHDVSLCELENELENIENFYFDAEINNDELSFDYRFKKGFCKNMNASFLLKKMEII